jgi:hypothetical protein
MKVTLKLAAVALLSLFSVSSADALVPAKK